MYKKYNKWWFLCTSFIIVLSIFFSYQLINSWSSFEEIFLPSPECDVSKMACFASLPSGEKIELNIKPTHMPILTSVELEVKTQKISAQKVYVEFNGAEMNMGKFQTTLKRRKQGLYTTQTILPTCSQEQMLWNAIVHIESHNKHYIAPFFLTTQHPENA